MWAELLTRVFPLKLVTDTLKERPQFLLTVRTASSLRGLGTVRNSGTGRVQLSRWGYTSETCINGKTEFYCYLLLLSGPYQEWVRKGSPASTSPQGLWRQQLEHIPAPLLLLAWMWLRLKDEMSSVWNFWFSLCLAWSPNPFSLELFDLWVEGFSDP